MNFEINIGSTLIGHNHPPFIIAEMSGNHNQSLERALKIVDAAAFAGADAIKLQTYTADTMTLNLSSNAFQITDKDSPWFGKSMYELYSEAHTPWEWHPHIMKRAQKHGLICFSSPFDETAVDLLESLDAPAYKIASFECVDIPLIERVARTGKPLIISTGMANKKEISEAVNAARSCGAKNIILLKCTSTYPASASNSNLLTLPELKKSFQCEVGLSDHTLGIGAAVSAVALGARVIEKHFTLSRADGGVDAAFSLEPDEMKQMVEEVQRGFHALGSISYGVSGDQERKSLEGRRSIYFINDLKAGDFVSLSDVARIRPAHGLKPKYLKKIIGERIIANVKRGTPVTWDIFSDNVKKKYVE